MSVNYYLVFNECSDCKRSDRLHIGQSAAGWQFCFRAYPNIYDSHGKDLVNALEADRLQTYLAWKSILKKHRIVNEYGEVVSYEDFISKVEASQGGQSYPASDTDYLDMEGYSMCSVEFS